MGKENHCNMSGGGITLDLQYYLTNAKWTGEDRIGDNNGYGHASDGEDGNTSTEKTTAKYDS